MRIPMSQRASDDGEMTVSHEVIVNGRVVARRYTEVKLAKGQRWGVVATYPSTHVWHGHEYEAVTWEYGVLS